MRGIIKKIAALFDLAIIKSSSLRLYEEAFTDYNHLRNMSSEQLKKLSELLDHSKSQIGQDLFVLLQTNFKTDGFFVEFGATNGVDLSNSYLLEKEFNWKGILAEPAKGWHQALKENRNCFIETNCVWRASGEKLTFYEVDEGELSTIAEFSDKDVNSKNRKQGQTYEVETISLLELLNKHNAPKQIDYLSIDTEGSEYEILSSFDFDAYEFKIISCEHNKTEMREKIYQLLSAKGYERKFVGFSSFDDWYVKK